MTDTRRVWRRPDREGARGLEVLAEQPPDRSAFERAAASGFARRLHENRAVDELEIVAVTLRTLGLGLRVFADCLHLGEMMVAGLAVIFVRWHGGHPSCRSWRVGMC